MTRIGDPARCGLTVDQSLRLMIDLVEDHALRKVIADLPS
jgi:hypothetical protein